MEWRKIESFDYEVSDDGRVRSLDRTIIRKGVEAHLMGRELAMRIHTHGYHMVALGRKGQRTVHSLVAAAFIGPRPEGFDVNHKDGDKTNNNVGNLEYITRSGNMRHAVQTGLMPPPPVKRGTSQHLNKLSEDQVRNIRKRYKDGEGMAHMARSYEVNESTIRNIIKGNTWAWLS